MRKHYRIQRCAEPREVRLFAPKCCKTDKDIDGQRHHDGACLQWRGFPDASDAVFYEVALSKEGSYLVTGNKKHFPKSPIVVTPAEMMEILAK